MNTGGRVLCWCPRAWAYVTSLARTRVLPLLGHTSLAPSVTVPMRPWCGQILHFGGKGVENEGQREEGTTSLVCLVEILDCTPRANTVTKQKRAVLIKYSLVVKPDEVFLCVCLWVCVNKCTVMHMYEWVQDTSMAMITALWEGRQDSPWVTRCSRVESR